MLDMTITVTIAAGVSIGVTPPRTSCLGMSA